MVSLLLISLLQVSPWILAEDLSLPWKNGISEKHRVAMIDDGILVIKGTNPNAGSELIVIRMDDEASHDYYSRVNLERRIKSGAFELRISMDGLKKENKKALDVRALDDVFIFNANKYSDNTSQKTREKIIIHSISIAKSNPLPSHIMAYDFGAKHSEVLEGTQPVTLGSKNPHITLSGRLREVDRPGPEPWGRDGIAGINELRMPLSKGLWRIVLFREDLGEWENLPRQLNLSLTINGLTQPLKKPTSEQKKSANKASQWYQGEYLKFYHQYAKTDPWNDIVRHRGLVQSYDFEQVEEELIIQLLGDSPQQRFISGMILQKLDERIYHADKNGLQLVNNRREKYFHQHWMIEDQPLTVAASSGNSSELSQSIRLAQGEGRLVEFDIELASDAIPQWESSFIQADGHIEVRQAVPRWRRQGSAQHLKKRYSQLIPLQPQQLNKGVHRISLWVKSDERQLGHYQFSLSFKNTSGHETKALTLAIEVLDQVLPINKQKVGIYLDHSPHLQYFKEWKPLQLAQIYCDLKYLESLDLRALSPPMSLPLKEDLGLWLKELALYKDFYKQSDILASDILASDILAYTPYKRLKEILDKNALQQKMAKLAKLTQGSLNVYWSIADEALADQIPLIQQDAQDLHSANQIAKVAGHLNNPNQKTLIKELDLILINHGFGINKAEVEEIHRMKTPNSSTSKQVWLYNMPDFRLAAGAFLWHSNADAYVQWHGRMPTANPYDPTDGREADYQFFYPQPTACMASPDVDKALFELAMGQYELRWYGWLEQQAEQMKHPKAKALKAKIERALGDDWQQAQKISHFQLDQWREQILTLAQTLKEPDLYTTSLLSGESNEQPIQQRYRDQK